MTCRSREVTLSASLGRSHLEVLNRVSVSWPRGGESSGRFCGPYVCVCYWFGDGSTSSVTSSPRVIIRLVLCSPVSYCAPPSVPPSRLSSLSPLSGLFNLGASLSEGLCHSILSSGPPCLTPVSLRPSSSLLRRSRFRTRPSGGPYEQLKILPVITVSFLSLPSLSLSSALCASPPGPRPGHFGLSTAFTRPKTRLTFS